MAVYGAWMEQVLEQWLVGKSLRAMLVTAAYDQSQAHTVRADITATEIVGTGYTAGGADVSGVAVTFDSATGQASITCASIEFGAIDTTDIAGIVFYVDTGNALTDVLVAADLFGPAEVADVISFTYAPSTDGLVLTRPGG